MNKKNQNLINLPISIFLGKRMQFEEAKHEKIIYDPFKQTTELILKGETGTGRIGTKSLKTVGTGTGKKTKTQGQDYVSDSKNEIDDAKNKD